MPTVAPTALSVSAEQSATPSQSILPTVAMTMMVESPLIPTSTNSISAAAVVTVSGDTVDSSTVVTTGPSATTTVPVSDSATNVAAQNEPCAVETDVALVAYPDLQQHLGCALGEASFDPVAINEFGPGPEYDRFMLWFSSENRIYVLQPNQTWQAYLDTWTEEQETFTCNPLEGEAASPPLPRRGFGKIWCTEEGLQSIMGLVEREERLCQHTVTQRFVAGRLIACYEDATIRFFRIMDNGSWAQMLTQ
ncbi:MAG: hypothetical protein R2867_34150 [Caldilineaceae bacterium]